MPNSLNRGAFAKTILAGLGAAALPSRASAQSRTLRIGCTSLVWGALPRSPENLAPAVKDMASLGFHGFETFAAILEDWDNKGTIGALLSSSKIPPPYHSFTVSVLPVKWRGASAAPVRAVAILE